MCIVSSVSRSISGKERFFARLDQERLNHSGRQPLEVCSSSFLSMRIAGRRCRFSQPSPISGCRSWLKWDHPRQRLLCTASVRSCAKQLRTFCINASRVSRRSKRSPCNHVSAFKRSGGNHWVTAIFSYSGLRLVASTDGKTAPSLRQGPAPRDTTSRLTLPRAGQQRDRSQRACA